MPLPAASLLFLLITLGPGSAAADDGLQRAAPAKPADQAQAAAGRTLAPSVQPLRDALAPLIADAQQRFGIPALSLALVRGDQALWLEGFGMADPAAGTPATARTRYRAGSLAKPITALLVLGLQAAGRLDIDQPLGAALPGFALQPRFDTTAQPITVRSVLSHHAGLPADLNQGLWSEAAFTTVRARLRDEYAAFPPNLVFGYSNLGYSLLGHLVQAQTQRPFAEHAEAALFTPLGMTDTAFSGRAGDERLAAGHRDGRPFEPLPLRDVPAQGLQTTAADLAELLAALLEGGARDGRQVIEPSVIEAMLEPQNTAVALDMDVITGLGLFLEDDSIPGAGRVARHSGNTLAYTAELILLPEQGLGVAVLANAGNAGRVVEQLAEAVLAQSLKAVPEAVPTDLFIAATGERPERAAPASSGGYYATDFGLIAIRPEAEQLCACMTGETLDLIPFPDGWLAPSPEVLGGAKGAATDAPSETVRPLTRLRLQTRRIDGREVMVADTGDGELVLGEKLEPQPPPQRWRERLGRWRVLNPDPGFPITDLTLKLTDGQLCMSYRLPVLSPDRIQVPLRAVDDDSAIILGLGRSRGESVRIVEHAGAARLRWSGYVAVPQHNEATGDGSIAGPSPAR